MCLLGFGVRVNPAMLRDQPACKAKYFQQKVRISKKKVIIDETFLGLRVHDSHNSRGLAEWVPPTDTTLHLELIEIRF